MVVEENVPQPHIIETGDSVKVKQVLDDALMAAVTDTGFEANYSWDNMKLGLMFLSCVFAMAAQFYPMPFPESRLLLFCCCAAYFVISSVLQIIVVFVDKDTVMFTKANQVAIFYFLSLHFSCFF
jgi:signal peptidase complex subunit 2